MAILTVAELERRVKLKLEGTGTCRAIDKARIIVPTACDEVVGFTNPDDLDVTLLERWQNGERGPEFENQKLQPGDCLVMYNNGRNINELLEQFPDWYKSKQGIKDMIERLYNCAEAGGKNTEPAIWNSDLNWAKKVNLRTTDDRDVTESVWAENAGVALEVKKYPPEQKFVHVKPGDKLISQDGTEQTAGAMSAIAVEQPGGRWNIVQLNAKGYEVVKENHATRGIRKGLEEDSILKKVAALDRAGQRSLDRAGKKELSYSEKLALQEQAHIPVLRNILKGRFAKK